MNQLIVVDFKLISFSAASRSHLVYVRLYWVQTNAIPVVPWLYWRVWARLVRRLFDVHLDVRPGLFCGCPYALCPAPRQRVDWNVTVVTKSRLRVPRLNSNAPSIVEQEKSDGTIAFVYSVDGAASQGVDWISNEVQRAFSTGSHIVVKLIITNLAREKPPRLSYMIIGPQLQG